MTDKKSLAVPVLVVRHSRACILCVCRVDVGKSQYKCTSIDFPTIFSSQLVAESLLDSLCTYVYLFLCHLKMGFCILLPPLNMPVTRYLAMYPRAIRV
jgi:hypothetical protein